MTRYFIQKEREGTLGLETALEEGYEPFAVTTEPVYDNPDSGWKCTGSGNFVWLRRENEISEQSLSTP